MKFVRFYTNVAYTQAKRVPLCLHIGNYALMIGYNFPISLRIELFTSFRKIRFTFSKENT